MCADTKKLRNFKTRKWIEEGLKFSHQTHQQTGEKKKIIGKYFHMQVDTGCDITLITVNFWQDLGLKSHLCN